MVGKLLMFGNSCSKIVSKVSICEVELVQRRNIGILVARLPRLFASRGSRWMSGYLLWSSWALLLC